MRNRAIAFILLLTTLLSCFAFTSCHKRVSMTGFAVPTDFDTSKAYEITFWQRMKTTKRKEAFTQTQLQNLKSFIQI